MMSDGVAQPAENSGAAALVWKEQRWRPVLLAAAVHLAVALAAVILPARIMTFSPPPPPVQSVELVMLETPSQPVSGPLPERQPDTALLSTPVVVAPVPKAAPVPKPRPLVPSRPVFRSATMAPAPHPLPSPVETSAMPPVSEPTAVPPMAPVLAASALDNPQPRYPRAARQRNMKGVVLLALEIDESGSVAQALVRNSSGFDLLDRAALEGARQWRFRPAQRGGQAVRSMVEIPVRFELEG
ncbi:MAG: TonB family protein [Alphaproteobacteria bacterium]